LNFLNFKLGVDVESPTDDWLVRSPDGNVSNFFIDRFGKIQSKFIGNERDLRVVTNTNLGTIVGFVSDEIADLHYEEIPSSSLQYYNVNDQNRIAIPPKLLEEGLVKFEGKNYKKPKLLEYKPLEKSKQLSSQRFRLKQDPFLDFVESNDWQTTNIKNKQLISKNNEETNNLVRSLKGVDVEYLPKALDFTSM